MHDQVYLTAAQVRARYGRSDMAIWRWLHDERMGFPQPYYFTRYRHWKLADLERWEASRAASPEAA
jgi:predicted DNA-binding transcriptional regulator AlpA